MPRGAAVIRYDGKRGVTWKIKWRDAAGRQIKETLGRAADGWNEQRAERELGKRLDRVEREHYRKPDRLTFSALADRFLRDYLPGRNVKPSTTINYQGDLRCHLLPFFGSMPLVEIEANPELIDRYIATKTREGLSPKTIHNHLVELSVMFKVAVRWRLVRTNPVLLIERPRLEHREMNVLSEGEIAALIAAYDELASDASQEERPWWRLGRSLTLVALGTALRRGELLALRWRDVRLLERLLTVRQSLVRGEFQTPKSRTSRRTIELGPRTVAVLQEHWRTTSYHGDDELVFCHPDKGTPLDPSKLARCYLRPALKHAGIDKPFRPWHDLRHTALTYEAAAGNPQAYVQMKAGHAQGSITERYIHAAQVLFPGAAEKGENRLFSELGVPKRVPSPAQASPEETEKTPFPASWVLPGLDSNQQPSG